MALHEMIVVPDCDEVRIVRVEEAAMNTQQPTLWDTSDKPRWYRGNSRRLGDAAGPVERETDNWLWITVMDRGATLYEIGQFLGGHKSEWVEVEGR